jgi:hypothetical protein
MPESAYAKRISLNSNNRRRKRLAALRASSRFNVRVDGEMSMCGDERMASTE